MAVATCRVDVKGLTLGGLTLPKLCNIPVIQGFSGVLLPNVFNSTLNARFDYLNHEYTVTYKGRTVSTPFADTEIDGLASYLTEAAVMPVAYNREAVVVPAREELVVQVRVPAHVPDDTWVMLTPLPDGRTHDIGCLVSYAKCKVKDGHAKLTLLNPGQRAAHVGPQTALCYFDTGLLSGLRMATGREFQSLLIFVRYPARTCSSRISLMAAVCAGDHCGWRALGGRRRWLSTAGVSMDAPAIATRMRIAE